MLKPALAFALALGLAGCNVGSQQGYEPEQPVAFSHAQHAGDLLIPCQYCHSGAERSRHAGVPPVGVCMNCHSQVKKDAPEIVKLYDAVASNRPIAWTKVHRLPDFAFFSHKSHVLTGGLTCQGCHGPVETMVRVKQVETMTMGWCLSCHRAKAAAAAPGAPVPPTDCAACHY